MPTPLPADKRSRLYNGMKARGMSPEEIASEFDRLEGYGDAPLTPQQEIDREVSPETKAGIGSFVKETLPRAAVAGAAGLAAAPYTAGMSMLPAMGVEGAATGLGDLAYQHVRNVIKGQAPLLPEFPEAEGISLPEAGAAAAGGAGGVPIGRGISKLLSFLSRVPEIYTTEFFRHPKNAFRYSRTFGELPADAEKIAAEGAGGLRESVENVIAAPIPERAVKKSIIDQATGAGTKMKATDIRKALFEAKIPNAKTDVAKAANAKIDQLAAEFTKIKRTVPSDIGAGRIGSTNVRAVKNVTPEELDDFLVRELDDSIYRQSGEPKDQILAKALAEVRPRVKQSLEAMVPTEKLTEKIAQEMDFRKDAAKIVNPELKTLEQFISNLHKPGHETERQMVAEIGNRMGIDLEGTLFKINQKRAFSGDPRVARKGVDFLWDVMSAGPKAALKIYAPAESLVAPAAAATGAAIADRGRIAAKKRRIGPTP